MFCLHLDTRYFYDSDKEVSSRPPPIPRRDIEVEDINVIVIALQQTRREHHDQVTLPSIKINNYM